jgi:hypothetical protein
MLGHQICTAISSSMMLFELAACNLEQSAQALLAARRALDRSADKRRSGAYNYHLVCTAQRCLWRKDVRDEKQPLDTGAGDSPPLIAVVS